MYMPDKRAFDLHNIDKKDFDEYQVTRTVEVEYDTISNQLAELDIDF